MAADDKARAVIKRHDQLKSDRGTFETHWQQCANYLNTNRNDYITERSPGMKRMQYVFDSHPIWCREQFAAGCNSFLTSSTLPWFGLRVEDDRIDQVTDIRLWLEFASMALYAVFNSPRYNFASQSNEVYDDQGTIGSACMAVLENRDDMPLFSTRHMKECCWAENDEDRVDTNIREFKWTARQAVDRWGAKAGEKVVKASVETPDRKFEFLHSVQPRKDRDPARADARHMAWESVYISKTDLATISESGFTEFPFLTPRFSKVTGEIYGRGPGMTALPDVKMLNEAMKMVVKAAQKVIDPPLELPDDGYLVPIKTVPGSLNFRRANMRPDDGIKPIVTGGNIGIGNELLEGLRSAISKVFFVDLLRMPSDPQDPSGDGKGSTATYWMQRREKEMMALAPFLARQQSEFTGPLIDRTFAMLWRLSRKLRFGPGSPFPAPPPQLSGQRLRVEYVSPIALAQKSSQLDALNRMLALQQQMRTIDPDSQILLDFEWIMRQTGTDLNAPSRAVKTAEQLQQEAQQKAEAEQAMQQHMMMANMAKTAKDGSIAAGNIAALPQQGQQTNDNSSAEAA